MPKSVRDETMCAPGKHSKKERETKRYNYVPQLSDKAFRILIQSCKICGAWRWAFDYGGQARGPYSQFMPKSSRPVPVEEKTG